MKLYKGTFYDQERIVGEALPRIDGTLGFHPERHGAWILSPQQLREIANILERDDASDE